MSDAVSVANVAGEEGISADEVILPANAADACSIPLLEPPAIARQPQDVPRPPRIGARIKCTSDSGCDLGVVLQVTEFLPGSMGGPKTGLSVQAQLCIQWDPPWDPHPGNLWWHEHCDRIVVLSEPDEVERSVRRQRRPTAQLGVGDRDGGGGGGLRLRQTPPGKLQRSSVVWVRSSGAPHDEPEEVQPAVLSVYRRRPDRDE